MTHQIRVLVGLVQSLTNRLSQLPDQQMASKIGRPNIDRFMMSFCVHGTMHRYGASLQLVDCISNTRFQGCADVQSLAKSLDHRESDTTCIHARVR